MSDAKPEAESHPLNDVRPRPVDRTPGKFSSSGKKMGRPPGSTNKAPRQAVPRQATPRVVEQRTAEDVVSAASFMAPAPPPISHFAMPRESSEFRPEYDGPGERLSREDRDTNQFELPPGTRQKMVNAGWDWSFKVIAIYGQPVDGTELLMVHNAGWRPARAKDFPELVSPGTEPSATIDRHGQRMFIRPAHMTHAAQEEDYRFAQAQMKGRMQASTEGRSLRSGEEGLADMGNVVQAVPIALKVEGETGTHGTR